MLTMLFLSKDIHECESSPCVHGSCTDQVNGYVCECTPGYIGVSCNIGKHTNCLVFAWILFKEYSEKNIYECIYTIIFTTLGHKSLVNSIFNF